MRVAKRKSEIAAYQETDPHLTRGQFEKYQKELEQIKKHALPRAIDEVQNLAKLGDFSENAAYQIAKGRLRGLNNRVLVLQEIIKEAIIIDENNDSDFVRLGSIVTLEFNGQQKTYQIVGSQETNPAKGRISHLSPIGSALLGHRIGDDIIKIEINGQEQEYKIIAVT